MSRLGWKLFTLDVVLVEISKSSVFRRKQFVVSHSPELNSLTISSSVKPWDAFAVDLFFSLAAIVVLAVFPSVSFCLQEATDNAAKNMLHISELKMDHEKALKRDNIHG